MSFWDDIGDVFKSAGESVFDFSKDVLTRTALAIADGTNLFTEGWQEVFSGSFKEGISNIAIGMGESLGLCPPSIVKQYEDAIGQASLWALQESKKENHQVCFSSYRDQVKANFVRHGLEWRDEMEQKLRDGLNQMPWINHGC